MSPLVLRIRTPHGLLLDQPVDAITAEDRTGWFGIRPGRADLVAVLPPGLLTWRDPDGEGFAALSGGLLELRGGECRVMASEAVVSRELEHIAALAAAQVKRRKERSDTHRGLVRDLARHALRSLARGEGT